MTTLHTERLTLREWHLDDFETLAAFLADDTANQYRGPGHGLTRNEAWSHLCEVIGQWHLRGYGEFAIEESESRQVMGWAGLWHPIFLDEPELSWSLFPAAQGKGYATEAAVSVQRWAAEDLDLPPLFSFVHPDNLPSRKLAERLGAVLEGQQEFRGQPRLLYRHRDLKSSNSNQSNQQEKELTCQS
ncbi:MAG: RimJ/RimL family protein N-acetyltransferase [Alphaproteobacteria bacterium]|jgi:RimJ/RimL family protein N-acetyltransferase